MCWTHRVERPTILLTAYRVTEMEQKRRRWIWIIGGIIVGSGLVVVVLCGGLGSLAWFGWNLFSEQCKAAMNLNPVIQGHFPQTTPLSWRVPVG